MKLMENPDNAEGIMEVNLLLLAIVYRYHTKN